MPPLTIASLPIAQPSFLQDSLAGQALVGKGLAGAHAGLQAAPAVLGAVAPGRPGVPTTWARSRKAPSASVRAQSPGEPRRHRPCRVPAAKNWGVFKSGGTGHCRVAQKVKKGKGEALPDFTLTSLQLFMFLEFKKCLDNASRHTVGFLGLSCAEPGVILGDPFHIWIFYDSNHSCAYCGKERPSDKTLCPFCVLLASNPRRHKQKPLQGTNPSSVRL